MDMVGTSLVKSQVSGITKSIGLSGDDEDKPAYDYAQEQKEDEKQAREKAKRDEAQMKKKAVRAEERNKMREKYGLKESETDQKLLESRDQSSSSSSSSGRKEASKTKGKDEGCTVM